MSSIREAWNSGKIILHPTDTIPGLSFNPEHPIAIKALSDIKGRPESKTCVCLAADIDSAFDYYENLPQSWKQTLSKIWPGPVSVVYIASKRCPDSVVRENGTIAIRVPSLSSDNKWLLDFIRSIKTPFPATSVNVSGQPSYQNWDDASTFLATKNAFIPPRFSTPGGLPSTLIEIKDRETFKVLREGAYPVSKIERILNDSLT